MDYKECAMKEKSPPKFKVGDTVRYMTETEIVQVYSDCDGTPLYQVRSNGYGIGENSLEEIKEAQ